VNDVQDFDSRLLEYEDPLAVEDANNAVIIYSCTRTPNLCNNAMRQLTKPRLSVSIRRSSSAFNKGILS
jgi:hypothetical protein